MLYHNNVPNSNIQNMIISYLYSNSYWNRNIFCSLRSVLHLECYQLDTHSHRQQIHDIYLSKRSLISCRFRRSTSASFSTVFVRCWLSSRVWLSLPTHILLHTMKDKKLRYRTEHSTARPSCLVGVLYDISQQKIC